MRKKTKQPAKRRKRQISADDYLRQAELDVIYRAIDSCGVSRRQATKAMIVETFLATGLRSQELADLEMRDLPHRRNRQSVKVRHGKGNVERVVEVGGLFAKRIEDYCRLYRVKARDTSPVFRSEQGGCLSYSAIYYKVKSFGRACGVSRLRPHMLRHTYASYLYAETADLRYVQEQLGHAKSQTTEIYTGLIDIDRSKQLDAIYK